MESCCWLNCLAVSIALFVVYKALDYLLRLPTIGRYSERYILVTGCDSGFGEALARRLDGLGCHVFACCLTEARQKELAKTCSERLQTLQMDVSQHDSVLQAFDFVKSKLPPGKGFNKYDASNVTLATAVHGVRKTSVQSPLACPSIL
jgi:NAD(P)-dependent dehydrogenase (short-subunit alcohol dehydrogenase family)